MDIYRKLKETESDKINKEIVNEIYPIEPLEKYYKFGYASCLNHLVIIANDYINQGHADKLDANRLIKIIDEGSLVDKNIDEYYKRLRNDEKNNKKLFKTNLLWE